jgi:hypothetical protein
MVDLANTVWRDFVTDGVPSSGTHKPKKNDVRQWGTWIESMIAAGALGGVWKATKSLLTADLAHAAGTVAVVYNDSTAANNGMYVKSGSSGSGSWTQITTFLPGYQFVTATDAGAGTANAIVATSSPKVTYTDGVQLIRLNIYRANTSSTVTVKFDGGASLAIKTAAGNNPAIGSLAAGMVVVGTITASGTQFRLLSDLSSAAIQAAAEDAADRAEAAAEDAETIATNLDLVGLPAKPIVILATGQSNITTGEVWTEEEFPSNLYVWNWVSYGAPGSTFLRARDLSSPLMMWSRSFGAQLARENPLRNVYVINLGQGGREITHWLESDPAPDPDLYADILANVPNALSAIGADYIDIFMWWQGESDALDVAGDGIALYEARFEELMTRFEGEDWFRIGTPKIISSVASSAHNGTGTYYLQINGVLQKCVANDPASRVYAYIGDIPEDHWKDASHMWGNGYELAGRRAYLAYRSHFAHPSGIIYERERGHIGIGAAVPYAKLTVSRNAEPNVPIGSAVETDWIGAFQGKDTEEARVAICGYANSASLVLQRGNTTAKNPSAIGAGQLIGALKIRGFATTQYVVGPDIRCIAAEEWTDTARGSRWQFNTISNGTATLTTRMVLHEGLYMDGATGGDKGAGTINATDVFDNGSVLSCYPFDAYLDGEIDFDKWDAKVPNRVIPAVLDEEGEEVEPEQVEERQHEDARKFAARLGTEYDPLDIDKYIQHWKDKRHLTSMPNEEKFDPEAGMAHGKWIQRLIETVEIQAIHIAQLNDRLKVLEAALAED